jgi:hypothetical protein
MDDYDPDHGENGGTHSHSSGSDMYPDYCGAQTSFYDQTDRCCSGRGGFKTSTACSSSGSKGGVSWTSHAYHRGSFNNTTPIMTTRTSQSHKGGIHDAFAHIRDKHTGEKGPFHAVSTCPSNWSAPMSTFSSTSTFADAAQLHASPIFRMKNSFSVNTTLESQKCAGHDKCLMSSHCSQAASFQSVPASSRNRSVSFGPMASADFEQNYLAHCKPFKGEASHDQGISVSSESHPAHKMQSSFTMDEAVMSTLAMKELNKSSPDAQAERYEASADEKSKLILPTVRAAVLDIPWSLQGEGKTADWDGKPSSFPLPASFGVSATAMKPLCSVEAKNLAALNRRNGPPPLFYLAGDDGRRSPEHGHRASQEPPHFLLPPPLIHKDLAGMDEDTAFSSNASSPTPNTALDLRFNKSLPTFSSKPYSPSMRRNCSADFITSADYANSRRESLQASSSTSSVSSQEQAPTAHSHSHKHSLSQPQHMGHADSFDDFIAVTVPNKMPRTDLGVKDVSGRLSPPLDLSHPHKPPCVFADRAPLPNKAQSTQSTNHSSRLWDMHRHDKNYKTFVFGSDSEENAHSDHNSSSSDGEHPQPVRNRPKKESVWRQQRSIMSALADSEEAEALGGNNKAMSPPKNGVVTNGISDGNEPGEKMEAENTNSAVEAEDKNSEVRYDPFVEMEKMNQTSEYFCSLDTLLEGVQDNPWKSRPNGGPPSEVHLLEELMCKQFNVSPSGLLNYWMTLTSKLPPNLNFGPQMPPKYRKILNNILRSYDDVKSVLDHQKIEPKNVSSNFLRLVSVCVCVCMCVCVCVFCVNESFFLVCVNITSCHCMFCSSMFLL